ncbi:type I restriction enzyme HsdR N-terminal domain-containing protein [Myroides sp. JBRI-B21084]|uniref:type I restriction enzyme HsdR N-terminal domain-containing protein n=1 Tax=Myroides sp. JBRI-B21084 TaxID=3119977 RepID=UPI0026E201A1|nr:type I restriction enzyme HsdR N-terminal domain-containing protein [Paenimyroides cloacae]WKW45668.1 type I restriction enzyme HsdR N-terminal domain-containing protein [Paenimyroides cloacae]
MRDLNFPRFEFRFKINENKRFIFDEIRKKYVLLTPEEWVRQHVIRFLIHIKGYPKSYINVEKIVKINNMNKRYDIVVFNEKGNIFLLVECKEPGVTINQSVFDQIARYNLSLNAQFLMITNGLNHYYCKLDYEQKKYQFLTDLP